MGTGDYICVTLRGGEPWGFSLREGVGDSFKPFEVFQVKEGGRAFLGGVRDGDEVVSLNGEPCVDLTLPQAFALVQASADCLQLLVRRHCSVSPGCYSKSATTGEARESTTLHILSPKRRSPRLDRDLRASESQDEAYFEEREGDAELRKGPRLVLPRAQAAPPGADTEDEGLPWEFSPGALVELQVALSQQTLGDRACTSLGSARGIEEGVTGREADEDRRGNGAAEPPSDPPAAREPLGQRGVVLSSPSMLGRFEVNLKQPMGDGRGAPPTLVVGEGGGVGDGGGIPPASFTVTFEALPGKTTEECQSDSEGDQGKPSKHHARHARLRRSESLSEKQVKEAKSKCKRIALLLTAAPPNPNNKGVLMFKRHRQRAKKYTLVSYGTGEEEPAYEDDEDEGEDSRGTHAVEFTLVATGDSELDEHFFTSSQGDKGVLTFNWDKGLLEIESKLNKPEEMDCLPDTKGKGALMFAQRRQRMDEIAAEHEELRRQGIPVEGTQEVETKAAYRQVEERSYMQATADGHAYMDVNVHQQSQQQNEYQQYQEQQYYEQQQHYRQQQLQYQQYQQQHQYKQQCQQQQMYPPQQDYQQQQTYQQQQDHHQQQQQQQQQQQHQTYQQQQQVQHYSMNLNGVAHHQTNEMQSSFSNRTAKPFSTQDMTHAPCSPAVCVASQDANCQGEQIASRDERISTPAIKTGLLQDTRRRNTGKPMFTFKEAPKVSPNPALLNLLNRSDKKLGFESGPEEDYLSLGAEACNFLQSPRVKHKTPPPVAPKPAINPSTPPWTAPTEVTSPDMPQHAENSVPAPAVAPTPENTPAPEPEPTTAPALEPSPPPAPREAPANPPREEQQQQQLQQVASWEENHHRSSPSRPEPTLVSSWPPTQIQTQQKPPASSWAPPAHVKPQEPGPSQSPPQAAWPPAQPAQPQAQPQPPVSAWAPLATQPQGQAPWGQPQEQAQAQTHSQPSWTQPREQPQPQAQVQPSWGQRTEQAQPQQVQPHWAQPHEQPQPQQVQTPWAQPQEPAHQQPPPHWAQQQQADSQAQPPWAQQPQQINQPQPPCAQQTQPQPESQPQPTWAQQPHAQAPQQAWPQTQPQVPPQPPWVSSPQPQQQQPQVSTWPPSHTQGQTQPPWVQPVQPHPPTQAPSNPWAPAPAQPQPQPTWAQQPPEHTAASSWGPEQNQGQAQPSWAQPVPTQSPPQIIWQQPTPQQHAAQAPPMNTWSPAQTQPVNTWAPQPQQAPGNTSSPFVNARGTQPPPKPWQPPQSAPQNRTPPPPPQRMNSYTIGRRSSSPINPMASVLNPSGRGSAYEMPAVRGKGAELFAKRLSRMEKFVVDSDTVQANKASRPTSPAPSLPNEWKYSPNIRAPPPLSYNPIHSPSYPPAAIKQPPPSSPASKNKTKDKEKAKPAPKPLNVVEVMKHQPYQLISSLFTYGPAAEAVEAAEAAAKAAAAKLAPEPTPSVQSQQITYDHMAPVQPAGPVNDPYPQQPYGMAPQPYIHDYQQVPANVYPPASHCQQVYSPQYQSPPVAYQHAGVQSPSAPYQPASASYPPARSPQYMAAPTVPYQQQPPSNYVSSNFPVVHPLSIASRPDSASGGNPVAAPKPKFTAKKSSAQASGRSFSLSPPARSLGLGHKSKSASSCAKPPAPQMSWLERGHKPPTPWEAASRHPLGLVDEAFAFQNLQQSIASNVRLAAQRKMLPEPPDEWTARVSLHQPPQKTGGQTWSQTQSFNRRLSRPAMPSFVSPTRSTASAPAGPAPYRTLPRAWQPPTRSVTEASLRPPVAPVATSECKRPWERSTYKAAYSSNATTWNWKR